MASSSSPVKPPYPPFAAHNLQEIENLVVPSIDLVVPSIDAEEITLDQFWEELHYNSRDFDQKGLGIKVEPKDTFMSYMNQISKKIHDSAVLPHGHEPIFFRDTPKTSPLGHPTGTKCRPDFSLYPSTENEVHWTEIEATIEIATEGLSHAISYTLFLLKARPDRVSVQGVYADSKCMILIISNSAGVKKSPRLDLENSSHIQLIYAFVKRLYEPHPSMIDPTINRRRDGEHWVFDIIIMGLVCRGYKILNASDSHGQRTHIFVNEENPSRLKNVNIPIIKDQYSHDQRFDEAEVIREIHAKGGVPGVVRSVHAELVRRNDNSPVFCGNRKKKRICLSEYGTRFMDIKTPLEVLKVVYDVLEVTRYLHAECKVLHRDISAGNVLYLEKDQNATALPGPLVDTRGTFCSVSHLLDPDNNRNDSTSTLLIDFNRAEILGRKDDEAGLERTGTPIFMARAVRKGRPLQSGDYASYVRMPELSPAAHVAYEKACPTRLARFPHSPHRYTADFIDNTNKPRRHELRHDAESVFWLLVWWAVHAIPEDATDSSLTEIPVHVWAGLNSVEGDGRNCNLSYRSLDHRYLPLEDLLRQLGYALQHDLHWATEEPYTHPDFLHEVFQRHILNFIFANLEEEFMKRPKADTLRQPEQIICISSLTTESLTTCPTLKRSRDSDSEDESDEAGSAKRMRSKGEGHLH